MTDHLQTHRFRPVGHCIYCGASGGKLSEEHIVPFGLGGNLILPSSSCLACGKITGRFEQTCQRKMLGPFRIRMGLPTRNPDQRPGKLPMLILHKNKPHEERAIQADEFPLTYAVPKLRPPGILRGLSPKKTSKLTMWVRFSTAEVRKHVYGKDEMARIGTVNSLAFGRMLAKIWPFVCGRHGRP